MDRHLADFSARRTALLTDLRSRLADALTVEPRVSLRHIRISFDAPGLDPRVIASSLPAETAAMFWTRPDQSFSFVGVGSVASIRATGERRFEEVSAGVKRLAECMLHLNLSRLDDADLPFLTGGYSFGPFNIAPEWREFGSSHFDVPELLCSRHGSASVLTLVLPMETDSGVGADADADVLTERASREIESAMQRMHALHSVQPGERHGAQVACASTLTDPPPRSSSFERLVADEASHVAWTARVGRALELIRQKTFDKIVLARELRVAVPVDAPALAVDMLNHLIDAFPDCSIFLKRTDSGACFIGASPERLIRADAGTLSTDALAGSISRGRDEEEDRRLAEQLLRDEKENLEHRFVVRQITQTLSGWTESIRHPGAPVIKKLRNLQHLHTPIEADVGRGIHLHGILEQLHPTPAVGGYPRQAAIPHIREIEQIDRGWYSGIVGWQGLGQDGDFAVAIRSALLSGTTARLFAGCGIVASSDPEMEWRETCLKAAPLADALEHAVRNMP